MLLACGGGGGGGGGGSGGGGVLDSPAPVSSEATDSEPIATSRSPSLTPLVSASLPGSTRLTANEATAGGDCDGGGDDDGEGVAPSASRAPVEMV